MAESYSDIPPLINAIPLKMDDHWGLRTRRLMRLYVPEKEVWSDIPSQRLVRSGTRGLASPVLTDYTTQALLYVLVRPQRSKSHHTHD